MPAVPSQSRPCLCYVLPARELRGTPREVLADLDDLMTGLIGLRQMVARESLGALDAPAARSDVAARRHLRLVRSAILALLALISLAAVAAAQTPSSPGDDTSSGGAAQPTAPADPWGGLKVGLALEGFYQAAVNRPPDRTLPLRAYDTRSNTFGLQQAALVLDAAPDVPAGRRYGARLDLQFGMATETVQGSPANEPRPDVYRHVWQAFGSYVVPIGPRGLQVDAGKFASILGYETNYAKDNQAFSRAFLFNFLPFYHSGLRLTLPVTDRVSVLYMLTNGIQQTEEFNDVKSSHVAALVKPVSSVTWTLNYYAGQEQPAGGAPEGPDGYFRVLDSYLAYAPSAAWSFGVDVNYVTNEAFQRDEPLSLQGLAGYGRYQLTPAAALGVRYERLDDEGLFGAVEQLLQESTLTGEYRLGDGFLLRAELRRDWSDRAFFPGSRGAGDLRRQQSTVLLGGIWTFGTKTGTW